MASKTLNFLLYFNAHNVLFMYKWSKPQQTAGPYIVVCLCLVLPAFRDAYVADMYIIDFCGYHELKRMIPHIYLSGSVDTNYLLKIFPIPILLF